MGTVPTGTNPTDLNPEAADTAQLEQVIVPDREAIPVAIVQQLAAHVLPNRLGATTTLTAESTGRRVVGGDLPRGRVQLWAGSAQGVIVAATRADAVAGAQAAIAAGGVTAGPWIVLPTTPLELQVTDELWAASTAANTPGLVCVVTEEWTK